MLQKHHWAAGNFTNQSHASGANGLTLLECSQGDQQTTTTITYRKEINITNTFSGSLFLSLPRSLSGMAKTWVQNDKSNTMHKSFSGQAVALINTFKCEHVVTPVYPVPYYFLLKKILKVHLHFILIYGIYQMPLYSMSDLQQCYEVCQKYTSSCSQTRIQLV